MPALFRTRNILILLKVRALEKKWNRWAEQQHVFPFEYRPWGERIKYYKILNPDQSGK